GQAARDGAGAGSDLDYPILGTASHVLGDFADYGFVDKEILAEFPALFAIVVFRRESSHAVMWVAVRWNRCRQAGLAPECRGPKGNKRIPYSEQYQSVGAKIFGLRLA